jgi:hypothetical protein
VKLPVKKFESLDTQGPFFGIEYRRTTRVEGAVPLVISGQNNQGQLFQESTWAISLNLHGCRYRSRHDCRIGTWITVQAGEPCSTANIAATRAQVKSIHAPNSARESYQIGIELETPGNIWVISSPPEDWLRGAGTEAEEEQSATAAAPERDPVITKMSLPSRRGVPGPEHRPVLSTPNLTEASNSLEAAMQSDPSKPIRIVFSPDELVAALEGKLQLAADKAAQSALASHLESAAKKAISITLELMERSVLEIERKLSARLSEAVLRAAEEFEGAATRTSDKGFERLVEDIQVITRKAAFQVEDRAAEARSSLETAANSALDEFRHHAEIHASLTISDTKQRVASSLASIDAENRSVSEAQLRALRSEVARTGEQFTEQFRNGLKAYFHSSLVAAVSAIEQHSKATFDGFTQESENSPPKKSSPSAFEEKIEGRDKKDTHSSRF